jgi:magnesium chelatase family protein
VQAERGLGNHRLTGSQLDDLAVSDDARQLLSESCASGVLNGRGYDRVRRVARTIADLGDRLRVEGSDVAEAIALRQGW